MTTAQEYGDARVPANQSMILDNAWSLEYLRALVVLHAPSNQANKVRKVELTNDLLFAARRWTEEDGNGELVVGVVVVARNRAEKAGRVEFLRQ